MKNKKGNIVWNFFASVKLALFTLFILAAASIIGTIIPQKEPAARYIELYGPNVANFFQLLDIPDMYASWWFTSMLVIFSTNLTICTIERFPHIWRIVTLDNLAKTQVNRLKKMAVRRTFNSDASGEQAASVVGTIMSNSGWKYDTASKENGTLFFSQKGAWTRLGVIIVHVSILVIFTGSLIGSFWGFKASVMIPEGSSTDKIYASTEGHPPIPFDGFVVKCDEFRLDYYDTGMPKDYISYLTVTKDNKPILKKKIEVNEPLKYAGLTFYQSSYQAIDGQFVAKISKENSDIEQRFIISPQREQKWAAENITFGITQISGPDFQRHYRYKIWFSDGKAGPSEFWITEGGSAKIKRPEATYIFTAKPRFATGLQVVKDPGVWTVYTGCIMMILGLIIIFFMSHRRIWVFVSNSETGSTILVSGLSNKNKIGFEKTMYDIYEAFEEDQTLNLSQEQS